MDAEEPAKIGTIERWTLYEFWAAEEMIHNADKRFVLGWNLGIAIGLCCMAVPCVGLFGAAWDWMFSGFGYLLPDLFDSANEWPANYGGGMEG